MSGNDAMDEQIKEFQDKHRTLLATSNKQILENKELKKKYDFYYNQATDFKFNLDEIKNLKPDILTTIENCRDKSLNDEAMLLEQIVEIITKWEKK